VVVVGGGPHALTVAAHLADASPALVDDLVVLDPSGGFTRTWRHRFAAMGIAHLRSPAVHQPDPDAHALRRFVQYHDRATELHGRYGLPGTGLFDDFCDAVVDDYGLADCVVPAVATHVSADGVVTVDDGSVIPARHVVLAHAPTAARWPAWAMGVDCVRHSDEVDLRMHPNMTGRRVAVVGGGIGAGHLACGAAIRGAHVHLVHRRPLVERNFDTDPGWLGPKEMRGFTAEQDLDARRVMAAAARGGGSIPGWILGDLEAQAVGGCLEIVHGDVRSCHAPAGGGVRLELTVGDNADGGRAAGGRAVGGRAVGRGVDVDEVWLATGHVLDVASDPIMGPLLRGPGRRLVGDFPVLDGHLGLPDTRVQVIGRPATLYLGPTAGNLSGARRAAELVVDAVVGATARA
jgi:hypothetical protein